MKTKRQSLRSLAQSWGLDYQTCRIKMELIDLIKVHCQKNSISQRKLALIVPGLTQDRVSKIFSGQMAHMTIDKLVQILSSLNYRVHIKAA